MTKRSEVAKDLFKEDIKDNFKRRITGGFWNTDANYPYKPHIGVDYGANIGEELIAYDDYEVIGINTGNSDYGKHVYLYFPKIDKTGHYAHMDSISVTKGQKGKARDVIGTSGNTGKSSGPHLHFGFANGKVTNTNKGTEGKPWINFETYVYAPIGQTSLVRQDGKFTVTVEEGLNVRKEPSINSERVTGLSKGQSVIYDNYVDSEGYRWVSWLHDGTRVYGARRTLDNKEIYGTAEFVNKEPSKPTPAPTPNPKPVDDKTGKLLVIYTQYLQGNKDVIVTDINGKQVGSPIPASKDTYNRVRKYRIVKQVEDGFYQVEQYRSADPLKGNGLHIRWRTGIGFE